jgi:hypothetical protein
LYAESKCFLIPSKVSFYQKYRYSHRSETTCQLWGGC